MALIPPAFLDSVVAIGFKTHNQTIAWSGTGFFYGYPTGELTAAGQKLYTVYLVTNKHVIGDHKEGYVRLNHQQDQPGQDFPLTFIDANGKKMWHSHVDQSIDLAVVKIDVGFLRKQNIKYYFLEDDNDIAAKKELQDEGIAEGDPVYVLGFPLGQIGNKRLYTICRHGIVARCRDWLDGNGKEILVDSSIFPGNSGGPVISSIYFSKINGTKIRDRARMLGIVQGYITYRDVAVSQQTKNARIIFEENSGLSSIIPAEYLREIVAKLHNPIPLTT